MIWISYSQFRSFAMCPRRWQLDRQYEPKVKAVALVAGGIFHDVIGKWYGTKNEAKGWEVFDEAVKLFWEEVQNSGANYEVSKYEMKIAILRASLKHYWDRVAIRDFDRFEFLELEKERTFTPIRGTKLKVILDGVWRERTTGVRYLAEHKYSLDIKEELMSLDLQVSIYTLSLLSIYGLLPTLYNVTRKPVYRKTKTESDSDFTTRVMKQMEKEVNNFEYGGTEHKSRFFVRRTYSRGRQDLDVAMAQMKSLVKAMKRVKKDPAEVYRNVGDHCIYMCPFREMCLDVDPILIAERFIDKTVKKPAFII
jgi:hypothetical protein